MCRELSPRFGGTLPVLSRVEQLRLSSRRNEGRPSRETERENLERQPAKSQSQNLASETKLSEINLSRWQLVAIHRVGV